MTTPTLARSVAIRFPLGSAPARVRLVLKAAVIAVVVLLPLIASRPPRIKLCRISGPLEPTWNAIHEYKETRLAWWADHRRCPTHLVELNPYTSRHDIRDEWGTPMRIHCEPGIFRIESAGQDREFHTRDDLVSDN